MASATASAASADAARSRSLSRKRVIGGRGSSLSYTRDERVFHRSDMPERALKARDEVFSLLRHGRNTWNTSTALESAEYPHRDRLRMLNFTHDPTQFAYNFRAEVLPRGQAVDVDAFGRTRPSATADRRLHRTQELPVHPELEHKPRWHSSTVLSGEERRKAYTGLMDAASKTSLRTTSRLTNHVSTVQREAEYMQRLRQTRSALAGAVSSALSSARGSERASSASRAPHYAQPTQMQLFQRMQADASSPMVSLTGALAAVDGALESDLGMSIGRPKHSGSTSRLIKKYRHEGVFGPVPALRVEAGTAGDDGDASSAPEDFAWSCCGSSDPRSRGCTVITVNPDKYCFDSI